MSRYIRSGPRSDPAPLPSPQGSTFEPLTGDFLLERAGDPVRVVRLWCDRCNKHQVLHDDQPETIGQARAVHRHGPRTSQWNSTGDDQ